MQVEFHKKTAAGFEYLERLSQDNSKSVIYILHGYGADAQNLAPIASYLDPNATWDWIFIEAPIKLSFPMSDGRAWFPIDEQALQKAMMTGIPREFASIEVDGLDHLKNMLSKFIEQTSEGKDVVVGGFSQGAMMSFHIHSLVKKLKGVIMMSGAPIDQNKFQATPEKQIPVMITHGRQDQVVDFSQGRAAFDFFSKSSNYQVEFCEFNGGHEIGMLALDKISVFLKKCLGKS